MMQSGTHEQHPVPAAAGRRCQLLTCAAGKASTRHAAHLQQHDYLHHLSLLFQAALCQCRGVLFSPMIGYPRKILNMHLLQGLQRWPGNPCLPGRGLSFGSMMADCLRPGLQSPLPLPGTLGYIIDALPLQSQAVYKQCQVALNPH